MADDEPNDTTTCPSCGNNVTINTNTGAESGHAKGCPNS